jgi:thioredoxin 1
MPALVIDFASELALNQAIEVFKREILQPFSKKLVLLFPYAMWCGPCRVILNEVLPLVEKEANDNVVICRMELDAGIVGNDAIASLHYRIRAIPALLFIKNGEVVNHIAGAVGLGIIQKDIEKYQ